MLELGRNDVCVSM